MRSVLIVTPFFAPQTHAAVFRAHKLAKYLPEHGWKPYVLTVDTNYMYNEDPGLLNELPAEVEIIRARYVEPTMRGLRMALGGQDRTYVAQKADRPSQPGVVPRATPRGSIRELASKPYQRALRTVAHMPDQYWPWYRSAVSAGRELVRAHQIDLVYSSSLPLTSHRIAWELQKLGLKWVADFRDPVTYAAKMTAPTARAREQQRQVMRETLVNADAVTGLASTYGPIFTDIYGPIMKRPYTFIPTGVDDALIPHGADHDAGPRMPGPYLIHVGEVMWDQSLEFFEIFARAANQMDMPWRLLVVGNEQTNRRRLAQALDMEALGDRVVFVDHIPQARLYQLIAGAAAGVLVPGRFSYWWTNHAKLVDYVGLRKPVLAMVPDPSEARSVLTRAGLGVFLDGSAEQAGRTLSDFLNGKLSMPPRENTDECDQYLATTQVRAFAHLFESCLE